jgi:hypothetical protein
VWLCPQKHCAPLVRGGFCFLATQQKFYATRTTYFLTVSYMFRFLQFRPARSGYIDGGSGFPTVPGEFDHYLPLQAISKNIKF